MSTVVGKNARQSRQGKTSNVNGMRNTLLDMPSAAELEELVQTSKLVPFAENKTDTRVQMQATTPATTAPSSAVPSPVLALLTDDSTGEAWPSLREAVSGWDFCSDGTESEDMWENLPEPAIDVNFEYVNSIEGAPYKKNDDDAPPREPSKAGETSAVTLADILRSKLDMQSDNVQPLPHGTTRPVTGLPSEDRPKTSEPPANKEDQQGELSNDFRQHGWTKKHKAPRNKKMQRKVAEKASQRAQQSSSSKNEAANDGTDENEAVQEAWMFVAFR